MKWIFATSLLLLLGCGEQSNKLSGTIAVYGDPYEFAVWEEGDQGLCVNQEGYADIAENTDVTVYDESQEVIAVGRLQKGVFGIAGGTGACSFYFEVDVPTVEFYTVEISGRGEQRYSFEDLEAEQWEVFYQLGL